MALLDLIRPQWKHSNPARRAQALRLLEEDRQEVFLDAALEDPDPALRLQAARRVASEAGLRQLLEKSQDPDVQEAARKSLNRILVAKVKAAAPGSAEAAEALSFLPELHSDSKALEETAREAADPELRAAALKRLSHASSILAVAMGEETPAIALAALDRLERDSHLQSVAKSARCREARAAAKARLKSAEEKKKPDAEAVRRAKLQLLLAVVEKADSESAAAAAGLDWEALAARVDEAEKALGELLVPGSTPGEGLERFRGQVASFRARLGRHRAAREERAAQAEAERRAREQREEEEIRRKEERRLQKEREEAERRQALEAAKAAETARAAEEEARIEAWRKAAPELPALVAELEGLVETPDLRAGEKRFRELQARWKSLLAFAPPQEGETWSERWRETADRLRETWDWHRWSNQRRKEDICARLEALPALDDGKAMVARFREALAEWKTLGPVPWDAAEALWDRYHAACDVLYEKCREYFAELDEEREANFKAKEDLCAGLESLLAQPELDLREAGETFREAQSQWKALGAVPRDRSEALWQRFRAACQAFYDRRDGHMVENLRLKTALAELAESLKDSTDWKGAGSRIKEAQEQWKALGSVPKDKAEGLWQRFHGACETFFQARKAHFEKLDQERPENLAKKTALCERMERLGELPGDKERYQAIREAQAEWKAIGPVPREQEDAIWERFRKPIDAYFEARKELMESERGLREENAKIKEDLCAEAEALRDSTEWKAGIEKVKALQARWKATGPAPRALDAELWRRFRSACDAFFDRLKEFGAQRDQERMRNLRLKEDLCFPVEILGGLPAEGEEAQARAAWLEGLPAAERPGPPQSEEEWKRAVDKVKAAQAQWRAIGPVPRERNDAIWERFRRACDVFFEERRRAMGLPADDPQANLEAKLALIAEAEGMAAEAGPDQAKAVEDLKKRWKRVGPVPRAQSDYVRERFEAACAQALGEP